MLWTRECDRKQDGLDERITTGYEKASHQAAGTGAKQPHEEILAASPWRKEKMIAAPAGLETFTT
jgi:hypothetical protein